MVSGTLAPLNIVFRLKLGCSGPDWLGLGPSRGGRTYGRMNGQKISPFYTTSAPIGAAAQKEKEREERERKRKRER